MERTDRGGRERSQATREGDFRRLGSCRLCQSPSFTNVLAPPQRGEPPRTWEVTLPWTGTFSLSSGSLEFDGSDISDPVLVT